MTTCTHISDLEKGKIHLLSQSLFNSEKDWIPHPAFRGVFLKHPITGDQTGTRFSAHIVKIEPGCILDEHIHDGKTELHEIIQGTGTCMLNDVTISYFPGDCAVISDNIRHKVTAGKEGLILLAKFMPALL
jgi:quercetin dioxygenase-like cupin family protein